MILAIDIGNTTVALGGIRDGRVCFVARMDTVRTRTAAEYRAEMDKIFAHRRHPERPMRFEGAVLTSVVPQITGALAECARHYTGKKPVIVSPDIRTGLTMGVDELCLRNAALFFREIAPVQDLVVFNGRSDVLLIQIAHGGKAERRVCILLQLHDQIAVVPALLELLHAV